MKGKESFDPVHHSAVVREVREEGKSQRQLKANETLRKVKGGIDKKGARRLNYLQERGTGTWLAATPTFACGTILSPVEFRDELRDRYGLDLLNVPAKCDGCNANFSVSHALGCKVGGLVSSRHNEGRDALVCFASAGFMPSNVRDEPLIHPCRDSDGVSMNSKLTDRDSGVTAEVNSDRGDILIRGFWERNTDCIVDVRICDVHQPSCKDRTPESVLKSAEVEKKKKYLDPCLKQRWHFTPFVVSCEGMLGKEADVFLKNLAKKLAKKWERPYSRTIAFVRTRFAISMVRAKNRCLRGSRIMTNSISRRVDWEDGAGLTLYSTLE